MVLAGIQAVITLTFCHIKPRWLFSNRLKVSKSAFYSYSEFYIY